MLLTPRSVSKMRRWRWSTRVAVCDNFWFAERGRAGSQARTWRLRRTANVIVVATEPPHYQRWIEHLGRRAARYLAYDDSLRSS